ncbi:hypothetical protein KKB99_06595 [bacterium]|nr:hypothetical protein [bacterium]MBU1025658.1 hypothetical protein [bacterium]
MPLIVMYSLMIFDLMMTLMHHEQAGELNPMFQRILIGQPVAFVYLKLIINSIAALGILVLMKYRPTMGTIFTWMGISVYLCVAYLHIEVFRVNQGLAPLLPMFTKTIDSFYY